MKRRLPCGILLLFPIAAMSPGWAQTPEVPKSEEVPAKGQPQSSGPPAAPPAEVKPAPAPAEAPPVVADSLKSRSSRVNGLLVAELEGGKIAGATSQLKVVAVPQSEVAESTLAFNQKIGPMMEQALQEVRKFQTIRQGRWPAGFQIEVSFADKYTPKDGPSAAVACALLLEGLFTGTVWDSAMAVTGDLNADGSVQPVGGLPAKIRSAVGLEVPHRRHSRGQ